MCSFALPGVLPLLSSFLASPGSLSLERSHTKLALRCRSGEEGLRRSCLTEKQDKAGWTRQETGRRPRVPASTEQGMDPARHFGAGGKTPLCFVEMPSESGKFSSRALYEVCDEDSIR